MRLLITQSLLSAWQYQYSGFDQYGENGDEYREKASVDFLSTLRREPRTPSEAMQKGIDFEDLVISICSGEGDTEHKWYKAAQEVAREVERGQFQVVATKELTVAGLDLLLYGRLDCLRAGRIKDIKYSSKYEVGKFFNSPQHPMYMEMIPEATQFDYVVSNGTRVWRETYRRDECRPVQGLITDFIQYLEINGLMPLYQKYWESRRSA